MRLALIYCAIPMRPSELGTAKKSYFKLFKLKFSPSPLASLALNTRILL